MEASQVEQQTPLAHEAAASPAAIAAATISATTTTTTVNNGSGSFGSAGKPPIAPTTSFATIATSSPLSNSSFTPVDRLLQKNPKLFASYSTPLRDEQVEDLETLVDLLFSTTNATLLAKVVPPAGHQIMLRRLLQQQVPELCRSYQSLGREYSPSPVPDYTDDEDEIGSVHSSFSITSYQTTTQAAAAVAQGSATPSSPLPRTEVAASKGLPKVVSMVDTTHDSPPRGGSQHPAAPLRGSTTTATTTANLPPRRSASTQRPHHAAGNSVPVGAQSQQDGPPMSTATDDTMATTESRYLLTGPSHSSLHRANHPQGGNGSFSSRHPPIRTPREGFMSSSNTLVDPRLSGANAEITVKVVVVGASGSGKTSFIRRIVNNAFDHAKRTTVGCEFSQKKYIAGDRIVTLRFWDIMGQENRAVLSHTFLLGAAAALICYDVGDPKSLATAKLWKREVEQKYEGTSVNSFKEDSSHHPIGSGRYGSTRQSRASVGSSATMTALHEDGVIRCFLVATKCDLMKRPTGGGGGGGGTRKASPSPTHSRTDTPTTPLNGSGEGGLPVTAEDGHRLAAALECHSHHFTSAKTGENCRLVAEHLVHVGLEICGQEDMMLRTQAPVTIRGADEAEDQQLPKLTLAQRVKKFFKSGDGKESGNERRSPRRGGTNRNASKDQEGTKCFLS